MSSLQETSNSKMSERRPYLRSASLEKIRCSAYYSIQLAGSILSKESLMQLFELLIIKSRNILQKAFLLLPLPAFEMCCAVVLYWLDAITKFTGIDVMFEKKLTSGSNTEPETTDTLKVQNRKTTRTRRHSDETIQSSSPVDTAKVTASTTIDDVIRPENLHPLLQERLQWTPLSKSSSERSLTDSNMSISSRHPFGMVVIVYGSATLVYLQLMILAAFLHTVHTPPGLVFLVSSLGYIGFIVYKMCFVKRKSKDSATTSSAATSKTKLANSSGDATPISFEKLPRGRLSRSTTRRFLDIHNKTLSKIKLL